MEPQDARVVKEVAGLDLTNIDIEINNRVLMATDLIEGQKTGFFLDQAYNISLVCNQLEKMKFDTDTVKVLDLCCYVGQWSTQITRTLKARGLNVEVSAVDVSAKALQFAKTNIERQGAVVNIRELDVLKDLGSFPDRYFDVVIADPPAFIKAKKDVPTGRHAYLKLNTSAFKLVKKGGLVVSCSCSGLFEESEMKDTLQKALKRGENEGRCILHGGHSPDHPVLLAFSEGFYLKMFVHHVL
jgi:23S rRNA (cytosine1962-C5)-methyltransferase